MPSNKVDVQGLVEDWGLDYFLRKASKKERKLHENDYITWEVDWKRVTFGHEEPKYDPEPQQAGFGKPITNVLFNTTFTNKTTDQQSYTFRAERTTRSACTVEIEEGYTQGQEMSVTLKTPCEILEANAGFHREMSLTNISGETIEQELSWGVDSEIKVKGKHHAEAKLIIIEEEYKGEFVLKTSMRGRVRVVFHNLKENNAFIKAVDGDIFKIVSDARREKKLAGTTIVADNDSKTVICTTRGKCNFKYGLRQNVEVDQRPIET